MIAEGAVRVVPGEHLAQERHLPGRGVAATRLDPSPGYVSHLGGDVVAVQPPVGTELEGALQVAILGQRDRGHLRDVPIIDLAETGVVGPRRDEQAGPGDLTHCLFEVLEKTAGWGSVYSRSVPRMASSTDILLR